ncbi:MAG: RnfABCDGE type electron transport complex subunit D [Candidatus Omnitrophica bacterium]|nr:RnfABCDGE type electron transport complex subunit D [Candidatus Omnitrophota bacterium]
MGNKSIDLNFSHSGRGDSLSKIMWSVVLSLVPAGIAGMFIFGLNTLWVSAAAIISAVLTEAGIQLLLKKKVTISDGSAFLTGLLLAYNLPPNVPIFLPIIGSVFAIAIAKQAFGGLGHNIFNPALAARLFLMFSWPAFMTSFPKPFACDAVTSATPLALLKWGKLPGSISYLDLFLGNRGGCIGEVCILALLLGAVFLFIKGYISWHIPLTYIVTCGLLAYVFGPNGFFSGDWLFHILSGGLILGAFFMATDYATSPLTRKGQIVFGIGCGIVTMAIRLRGAYPEGVSCAILLMNAVTPLINEYIKIQPSSAG